MVPLVGFEPTPAGLKIPGTCHLCYKGTSILPGVVETPPVD